MTVAPLGTAAYLRLLLAWWTLVSLLLFLPAGTVGYWSAFRANRYAARIIEVEPDQQVVSIGPYAVVRHR